MTNKKRMLTGKIRVKMHHIEWEQIGFEECRLVDVLS